VIVSPTLTATSYKRGSGSHATGNAIDLAIAGFGDKIFASEADRHDYYFSVYFDLIDRLDHGRIRVALPPDCLHFHIDTTSPVTGTAGGYERLRNEGGRCILQEYRDYDLPGIKAFVADWMREAYGFANWQPQWVWGGLEVIYGRLATSQVNEAATMVDKAFALGVDERDYLSLLGLGGIGALAALVFLFLYKK